MMKRNRNKQADEFLSDRPYMPSPDQYVEALGGEDLPEEPPRKPRRGRRIVGIFLTLILVAVGLYGYYIVSNVVKISSNPVTISPLAADASGRTNILLLGRGDPGHAGEGLTDTIMVLSYDRTSKRIAQISIPRDLRVAIAGYGTGKINAAGAYGGTELATQTVANTLELPIHYVVTTDFGGLKGLVDAVGGIDVDVKEALVDTEYPCEDDQYKVCGLNIQPGLQHMDGSRALQYVRCRKGTCGNDFGRAARQQEVITLVRQKLVTPATVLDPRKLVPVSTALKGSLQTDMGVVQLLEFGLAWKDAANADDPIRLVLSTAQGGYLRSAGGSSDLVPTDGTFAAIRDRVKGIFTQPEQAGDVPE